MSCWGFDSGSFVSEVGLNTVVSTSIDSVCDRTSNRFLDVNIFSFLVVFCMLVGELGSEELEWFLFPVCCFQSSLFELFEFV